MNRIVKWAAYGLGGVAAMLAVAVGGAFAASEVMLRLPQAKPPAPMVASSDAGAAERGRKIAVMQGCLDCHGKNLQGQMFDDIPNVARLYAPNLTLAARDQSDADLDRAIRHGVGSDGRALWVMPSATFSHLTDQETSDLIAYVRTFRPAGQVQPRMQVGPVGRLGMLLGKFKPEAAAIAAHQNRPLPDLGPAYAEGRGLARACVECHGPTLEGAQGILKTPDLSIAAAYDDEDFARLMRTGRAAGDREVGLMSRTARSRFASLTDEEVSALHGYLKARAARQMPQAATKNLSKP
jgi:mono/diheme cytochrome c family protein